jgi:alanine dehydrogenase
VPYGIKLADKGFVDAVRDDAALGRGVNVMDGKVTYQGVADAFDLPYVPLNDALAGHHA